jgi:activating signal cointegrator 1
MKALSLLQPWASLVVMGVKQIETRSWATPHRGTLLIHASAGKAGSTFASGLPFTKFIRDFRKLPFGCVIGQVTLIDIVPVEHIWLPGIEMEKITLEEKAFGDYSAGRFAWILADAVEYENPLPARGQLRLWDYRL